MAKTDGIEDSLGVSLLPETKRSSSGSGLRFKSLYSYPSQNFKLKQTAHCLSITSEHQQPFIRVEDKPEPAPSPPLKCSRALITKSPQLAAFSSSSSPVRKGSNIGQFQPRKLLEDSLGTGGIQADESHTNFCVLFGFAAAFPPRWQKHCSTAA